MVILDRNADTLTTEFVRDSGGGAKAFAHVISHIVGGSLVKVVMGPTGYFLVEPREPAPRYLMGYIDETAIAGEKIWVRIAGRCGPMRLHSQVDVGEYLAFSEGHLRSRSGSYIHPGEFGVVVEKYSDDRFDVMLFPETVVET